jgi:hypothetical protein
MYVGMHVGMYVHTVPKSGNNICTWICEQKHKKIFANLQLLSRGQQGMVGTYHTVIIQCMYILICT